MDSGGEPVNVPNVLTAIRFVIVPIFGYFLHQEQYIIAICLFLLGGITDILDGYIARKYNLITSFGKLADPLADKLMLITAIVFLTLQGFIPSPVLVIVIAKEFFMGIGSIVLYKNKNTVVAANWYGKLTTVIFFFAIVATIIVKVEKFSNQYTDTIVNALIVIAVLSTLVSFFLYSVNFVRIRKGMRV